MPAVLDSDGKLINLGSEIGRGGEGAIFEVASNPSIVAKLYHKPLDTVRVEKLSAMVQLSSPDILKFSAWPISTLKRNGSVIGLLMRRLGSADRPVHELYTPKTRLREFPKANWLFLIHVATNIARGFAVIHQAGHVVGDVNHGNILVSSNGLAAFIDCDSFQIASGNRLFPCDVGVSTYTPPELQNRQFNSVRRTRNHDEFGMAVLFFHLLFMGRHPFAGRFSGPGDMSIERAIAECRFPYGRMARQAQMSPPPNSLLLNQVSKALADAFEKSFSREAAQGTPRTTAREWIVILDQMRNELKHCSNSTAHTYFRELVSCPWCTIESHGIILFLDLNISSTPNLHIDELLRKLSALPSLGNLPPIPTPTNRNISVIAEPQWKLRGRNRRFRIGLGVAALITAVFLIVRFNLGFPNGLVIFVIAISFAYLWPQKLQRERVRAKSTLDEIRKQYMDAQNRYVAECSDQPLSARFQEVNALRAEYVSLPILKQKKLQELERNKYQLQLNQFLDRFDINDAVIPKIGPGRKQMLISYQVETAADITPLKLQQVPGIGPKIAGHILAWRLELERRFKFDPAKAVDKSEIDKIGREFQLRGRQLEQALTSGIADVAASHASVEARRKAHLARMESIVRDLVQAEANYRAS